MANAKKITMDELLVSNEDSFKKVVAGDTVKGTVLSVKKHEILIDLGAQGVGLIPRREASFARNLKVGDEVTASVVEAEIDDGYVLLSLRKAVKDKGWDEITAKLDSSETVEVTPFDANRGGLLVEYEGIRGFMPVSQLSKDNIEEELQKHQVADELIKEFINNLNECEFARYAPGNQDEKMDKIYSSAIDVISKMENSIKR